MKKLLAPKIHPRKFMIHDLPVPTVVRVNHDILHRIGAQPGGAYKHCGCSHRQALQQSRQVFHGQKM
jgi:hypothetical protein